MIKDLINNTKKNLISNNIQTFKDIPYVFNLGHGILPQTDPVKVETLIKFYRNFDG